ncbi:MAG: pyridoxal-phosphate dependent enzyme [Lachnospiraceae bacterium]|nr:pyridoxal-phosphate dependent enzyme [Lachnospiraceae bacterium]
MKKLVIIGANEFQNPLILKAKEMGYETHVFAWKDGAVGESTADCFYPVSIVEVDKILEICKKIKPDGIATIGSDLANITVAKLAAALDLPGNDLSCIEKSTNKASMRHAFEMAGVSVPFYRKAESMEELHGLTLPFPLIVKPTDRSGSRAITKVTTPEQLAEAIRKAVDQSFEKKAIVEGYLEGSEYSMETISYRGEHTCLAITKKFTTGSPHYIETGHLQPAPLSEEMEQKCICEIKRGLDALEIKNGASHAEFRIDKDGNVHIIEIGSRMGGDCIGSDLVPLSTGQDFVRMVIQTAVGERPELTEHVHKKVSAIRFILSRDDITCMEYRKQKKPEAFRYVQEPEGMEEHPVTDSGSRYGFYILQTDTMEEMQQVLHMRPPVKLIPEWETPIQEIYGWESCKNRIYMKREDLLGFSFGGNKVRFANAFLSDMEKKNCDSMIIYGNYHSNLCRILSAACKREKIPCFMVYNQDDLKEGDCGNGKLIRQMGAIPVPCGKSNIAEAVQEAMDTLEEQGYRPYYIYGNKLGRGNESVPMESYVRVYDEILKQQRKMGIEFDYIFLASSTNATQSGLTAARIFKRQGPAVVGISVSRKKARGYEVIEQNISEYCDKKGLILPENWNRQIHFTDEGLLGGYGLYDDKIEQVILRMYEENGIALDPVYTGKGFRGMLEHLENERISGKNILFLHTGGTPLYFDFLEHST